jgi:sigma-B regulation protein RsbU (phosphoserine phosphatase)
MDMDALFTLEVARRYDSLADAQARLGAFLSGAGCDARTMFRVEVVVEELVVNVIQHGVSATIDNQLTLCARVKNGQVQVALEDGGPEFDPLQFVPRPLPRLLEEESAGGNGLRLVRKMADAFSYTRTEAGLNRMELEIRSA